MLTFSTGHGGSLGERARGLWGLGRHNRRFAAWDYRSFAASRDALRRHAGLDIEGARVLDLGCGQRFPALLLFHAHGARATGIDTDVVDPRIGPGVWLRILRHNGVERLIKTLARRILFDGPYLRELGRVAGRRLPLEGLDLRLMDARTLEFPDGHFDLVHSCAVFEHLADVTRVVEEMARVLRPGGMASIVIHLFTSLSGGHHPEWTFPDEEPSRRIPPWDHLRGNLFPTHAYLNRWREARFRGVVGTGFDILEEERFTEGERLLSPDLEKELSAYTRPELTTRAVRWALRRR